MWRRNFEYQRVQGQGSKKMDAKLFKRKKIEKGIVLPNQSQLADFDYEEMSDILSGMKPFRKTSFLTPSHNLKL